MVRGHTGPGRILGTQGVLRAGLFKIQQRASASVRGVCAPCLFLCSSRVDLHPHRDSVVRRDCSVLKKKDEKNHNHNKNHNKNKPIWGGSVLAGEEPPLHCGELNHALSQVGGPTQPMSSRHHISMEHRLRRKLAMKEI